MFKKSSKSFTQQRAVLKPIKNSTAIMEEDEDVVEDDSSSCYSVPGAAVTKHDVRHDTMLLAEFFSTTGPEEYLSPKNENTRQQFKRASRLLSRLRKKPTMSALQQQPIEEKRTHIPLPAYKAPAAEEEEEEEEDLSAPAVTTIAPPPNTKTSHHHHHHQQQHPTLRDSGIYSETASDRDSCHLPPVPSPQAQTPFFADLRQFPQPPFTSAYKSFPRRPPPLPPAVASAAIANACLPVPTTPIRGVPEAALKRRSVRLRHVQVQTEQEEEQTYERKACPHCRQTIGKERARRPSCPPALSTGDLTAVEAAEDENDTKALLALVVKLKSQLAEEKQCRIKLENQMTTTKKEEVAKEKDKWAGDCLWLNDRIALLPE